HIHRRNFLWDNTLSLVWDRSQWLKITENLSLLIPAGGEAEGSTVHYEQNPFQLIFFFLQKEK
ncbi:MAG: hypothetical protein GPJ54_10150, partial [Candidatus Heimdallarchaeota archaeon]|nr:hypothetical protein [Candidatus Heimdallarchaeota archaeon]